MRLDGLCPSIPVDAKRARPYATHGGKRRGASARSRNLLHDFQVFRRDRLPSVVQLELERVRIHMLELTKVRISIQTHHYHSMNHDCIEDTLTAASHE